MIELARLTTDEAAEALRGAEVAVLPVGSIEQHGPHLPMNTDLAVAEALARRVAERLGGRAILCPAMPFGLSEHHLAFAGTITLRPNTFLAVIGDVLESLVYHGIRRVLVVNGHGGNLDALRLATRIARRDHGMMVASVMWSVLAADVAAKVANSVSYGHACEVETSVALALFRDEVREDRLTDGIGRRQHDPLTTPPGATVDEPVWLHEWTEDGALGQPALATVEGGQEIVDVFVDRAAEYALRMIGRDAPEAK